MVIIVCGIFGYMIYTRPLASKFEPYISIFHVLFEDASHNLLGNLTGKLEIAQINESTVVSTFSLTFSSERLSAWHKPCIDNITVEIMFAVRFRESDSQFSIPLPPFRSQTLNDGEKVVFYEKIHDISKLKQPVIYICCVLPCLRASNGTIPSIQVYFSDGQVWRCNQNIYPLWQDKYEYPPPMIGVKLSELRGKIETTTITLITVE